MRKHPIITTAIAFLLPAAIFGGRLTARSGHCAWGAEGDIRMAASAGFSGKCIADRWCPLLVDVKNTLEDVDADLLLEVQRNSSMVRYRKHIGTVSKGFKGRFRLNFWCDPRPELFLRLVEAGEDSNDLAEPVDVDLTVSTSAPHVIARVGGRQAGLQGKLNSDWLLVDLDADKLPQHILGYDAITALVVYGEDMGHLDNAQYDALKKWLRSGGELYCVGTSRFWKTEGILDELLPVAVSVRKWMTDPVLSWPTGRTYARIEGSFASAGMTAKENAEVILKTRRGESLAVRRAYGLGWIGFIGFNPRSKALNEAIKKKREDERERDVMVSRDGIWTEMLCARGRDTIGVPLAALPLKKTFTPSYTKRAFLSNVAGKPMPRIYVIGFLLLFCAAIGPADYLLLRKFGNFRFGLLTLGSVVTLFTVFAYLVGYAGRSNTPELRSLSAVDVCIDDHLLMRERYDCAAFSPEASEYELTTGKQGSYIALAGGSGEQRPPSINFTPQGQTVTLPMKIWTPKTICCRWLKDDFPGGSTPRRRLEQAVEALGNLTGCSIVGRTGRMPLGDIITEQNVYKVVTNTRLTPAPRDPFQIWLNETEEQLTSFSWRRNYYSGIRARLLSWLSFGPADTRFEKKVGFKVQGLPTDLCLRRNVERGRVYLVGMARKEPLNMSFSGEHPVGNDRAFVRIDITNMFDPDSRWRR